MNSIPSTYRKLGLVLLALWSFGSSAQAGVQDMNKAALDAMKLGKWAEAHQVLVKATNTYDARALQLYGPRFGWFWYHRGFCELKLNLFDDAIKSFKVCYERYKNTKPKEGQAASKNFYEKKALLMWGHAAKGAEEWQESIRMYKRFLSERDPSRDRYEKGVFFINMAINHFKLKKIKDGNQYLETAIKEKTTFPTPNKGIMAAFNAMVAAVIEDKKETELLDFISKNRAHIKLEPFEAHEFSPLFMKLAQDANSSDMIRSTFELYSLVPSTTAAIDDIQARLKTLSTYERTIKDGSMIVKKSDLTKDLEELNAANKAGKVNEVYAYLNTAVLHESDGNVRGAFAVYEQMELYFPNAKIMSKEGVVAARENNLYNLVRTSAVIGEVLITEHYGSLFLKDFPDSKHVNEVRRLMLTSLFFNGEYEKCIEVAEIMMPKLAKPSKQHEVCLFVLGGSKHYLGEFFDAQPLLNDYVKMYGPDEKTDKLRLQAATYFKAANYSRLQEWTLSARLLDEFFAKYPDPKTNVYYPFALFDRANCYYAESDYDPALEKVTRIETEFPGVSVMEQNLALKGNILEGLKKPEDAEKYYLMALELAEQKKNDLVAGECLFYLTAIIGVEKKGKEGNPRMTEAVPYYTKFWKEYGYESPFKAKVAVAGIPAMRAVGKIDEALERLQTVIAGLAKTPGAPGLEESIGSYTDEYLKEHTPAELKDHFYSFPGIDSRDKATRALLRIAIIGVYEDVLDEADPEKEAQKARDAQARIDTLFRELQADFDPKELSNFILVKVGNFIRKNTSNPSAARLYYEEALSRTEDQSHKFAAIFGLADINAKGTAAQKSEAIKLLKRVIADSDDEGEKEEALYLTVSIHADNSDYEAAIVAAKEYLENKTYRRYSVDCRMLLGSAHDKAGRVDDALAAYTQVWSSSMGTIRYSAPAMERWMKLLWGRGRADDRQLSYARGYDYVKLTKLAVTKATPAEKKMWDKVVSLVDEYEANSDTTPIVEEEEK